MNLDYSSSSPSNIVMKVPGIPSSSEKPAPPVPPRREKSSPCFWTPKEDELLKEAIATFGARHWKNIAVVVKTRTHSQCFQRWHKVLRPGLRKGRWTLEEDHMLKTLALRQLLRCEKVGLRKKINWGVVSMEIKGRTAKQCRERWLNNVNPAINRAAWTKQEDNMLLHYCKTYPKRWAFIAKQLNGRTENAVKLRFQTLQRQNKIIKDTCLDMTKSRPEQEISPGKRSSPTTTFDDQSSVKKIRATRVDEDKTVHSPLVLTPAPPPTPVVIPDVLLPSLDLFTALNVSSPNMMPLVSANFSPLSPFQEGMFPTYLLNDAWLKLRALTNTYNNMG